MLNIMICIRRRSEIFTRLESKIFRFKSKVLSMYQVGAYGFMMSSYLFFGWMTNNVSYFPMVLRHRVLDRTQGWINYVVTLNVVMLTIELLQLLVGF
jgi:hypothetical protein